MIKGRPQDVSELNRHVVGEGSDGESKGDHLLGAISHFLQGLAYARPPQLLLRALKC